MVPFLILKEDKLKKNKSIIRKCLFYPSTFQIIGFYAQFIPFKLEVVIDFVFITHKFGRCFNIDPSLLPSQDELVSKSRTRYYVNSQQHRVKNRIWQILLVLFPKFDQV